MAPKLFSFGTKTKVADADPKPNKLFPLATKGKVSDAKPKATPSKKKTETIPFVPGTAGYPTSTMEITISCRNLVNRDLLSKSDPVCIVYHKPPGTKTWYKLMKTEIIYDDLDPDFERKAIMPYYFERVQPLRFELFDVDYESDALSLSDSLGYVETTLGQIVVSGDQGLTLEMITLNAAGTKAQTGPTVPQTIILTAEEFASEKEEATIRLGGSGCGSWWGFIPPRTFYAISKKNSAGRYLIVYRSKLAKGSSPVWPTLKINCRLLCMGDLDRELKIEIFQKKLKGHLVRIGHCFTTVRHMIEATRHDQQERIKLITEQQKGKSFLRVIHCSVATTHTFVDYIQGGTQIQCTFAIDFTCSNGDPMDPLSLHFIAQKEGQSNVYEQAIQAVGNILKEYDETELFPAFGFGARLPPEGEVSYNFPLTLSKNPYCNSMDGVLDAYRTCLKKIALYGPTNFATIITGAAEVAKRCKTGEVYHLLVIITDGVITDMQKTKKAIVEASVLPMSIIIIGVGDAEFDAMEELDSDAAPLAYKRKQAARDIVQFVAYRSARAWMAATGEVTSDDLKKTMDQIEQQENASQGTQSPHDKVDEYGRPVDEYGRLIGSPTKGNSFEDKKLRMQRLAQSQLAQEVLAEIPEQLTSYMKMKGIAPNANAKFARKASKKTTLLDEKVTEQKKPTK